MTEFRSIKKQVFYSNTELFDGRAPEPSITIDICSRLGCLILATRLLLCRARGDNERPQQRCEEQHTKTQTQIKSLSAKQILPPAHLNGKELFMNA